MAGAEGAAASQQSAADVAGVSVDAIKANTAQLEAVVASLRAQREARAANLNPRPDEAALGRLDSSVKKNGAFIKRLRTLGADNKAALLAEADKLNLSKYVSEAVAALSEAPLKASDMPAVLEMAAFLHQRYPEFGASLAPAVAKAAAGGGSGSSGGKGGAGTPEEERAAAARRQRGPLRLLPELVAAGICADAGPLLQVIKAMAGSLDFSKAPEASLASVVLLGGCIKAAAPLLLGAPPEGVPALPVPSSSSSAAAAAEATAGGSSSSGGGGGSGGGSGSAAAASLPLPQELLLAEDLSGLPLDLAAAVAELQAQQKQLQAELQQRFELPADQGQLLSKMFDHTFDAASAALVAAHAELITLDKENARILASKGELPPAVATEYEARRRAYESLHRAVVAMADALARPLPELAEDAFTRIGAEGEGGSTGGAGGTGAAAEGQVEHVFEDAEVRAFYECLPDIWVLVPAVLLKDATRRPASSSDAGDSAEQAAAAGDAPAADAAASGSGEAQAPDSSSSVAAPSVAAAAAAADATDAAASSSAAASALDAPGSVDLVLARLPACVSRDLADELAVNFLFANSKGARKRLARSLVDVPRGNLQLLPYYARVAAIVSQAYPELGSGVVSAVEADFDALAVKKDLTARGEEPRLRVARYLAELAKFRLAAPATLLTRLKALLDDFSGPNVEAAAALVESAGRFLLRLPESRVRADNLLGVMMRLRNARNLDSRQTNAIDNAYFACRPPDKAASRRRTRTPLQEYIHHLIFERLGDTSIVEVLKKLMKLPWFEAEPYLLKCLTKVVRVRFQHIGLIASLAGGLAQYHDSLGVGLVDLVMEDVRWGLDHPYAGNYQQRLAQARLLGEAYNYMLLDSRAVFDVLYLLIGYGHESEAAAAKLDPPDDFFRLRMVIVLLNTCGSYFNKGAAKRRLDRFLTFLQAYVLAKQLLPLDVEADLHDVLSVLRPSLVRAGSYEEAAAAVAVVLDKEAAARSSGLEPIDEDEEDEEDEEGAGAGGAGAASGSQDEDEDEEEDTGDEEGMLVDEYDRGAAGGQALVDDEFEREYASLLQECQGRGGGAAPAAAAAGAAAASRGGAAAASAALSLAHRQQQQQQQLGSDDDAYHEGGDGQHAGMPAVAFKMLMKRGGKDDRSRELHIPADAAIAARVLAEKASEEAERSQIKALVLQANQRDEAEEAAAAAAARAARSAAYRSRGGGGGQLYRRPPSGGRGGPQLTIARHVNQLTGGSNGGGGARHG